MKTTDSRHRLTRYPNRAKDLVLTDVNQFWIAEIVCSQVTKTHVFAFRIGGDNVTNLDLSVGHDHAVDQRFDQLALLLKVGIGKTSLYSPTELIDGRQQFVGMGTRFSWRRRERQPRPRVPGMAPGAGSSTTAIGVGRRIFPGGALPRGWFCRCDASAV